MVKKKERTIKKEIRGENTTKPRIEICCRVRKMEYRSPTNMNIRGDLIPWKNMSKMEPFKPIKDEDKIRIGTPIIWDTEEYATKRLKSDWKQQTKVT